MPKRASSEQKLEDKILENLVDLQKVHTNLAEKFDKLAKEISNLLALFELAARSFSKHPALKGSESDREFLEKIDKLLEQNKTIAKGLTLMEEQIRRKAYSSHHEHTEPIEHITENEPEHHEILEEEKTEDSNLNLETSDYIESIKPNNRPLPKF